MENRISVIVPLYHGKKYIDTIIRMMKKNIRHDRQKQYEIELIFINDYPNEDIFEKNVINQGQITDMRLEIKLITNKKNMGIHYSRVRGLSKSTGNLIHFLDQDDIIMDSYYESQLNHIKGNAVVVSNGQAENKDFTKYIYRYNVMQWTVKHIWFYAKYDCRIISPGQCLIRKECIPQLWKDNILHNNGSDDFFLWLLMLSNGCSFGMNRESIYIHIYTEKNASLDSGTMLSSTQEILDICDSGIKVKYKRIIQERLDKTDLINNKSVIVKIVEALNLRRQKK